MAGGGPVLLVTLPLAVLYMTGGSPTIWRAIYLAALPLIVAFALTLPSCIFIGLPLFLLLRWRRCESDRAYMLAGALFGLIVPLAVLFAIHATAGYWTCALGLLAGVTAAHTWWSAGRPK